MKNNSDYKTQFLPSDYDGILDDYDPSLCECGKVELIPPSELELDTIYIEGPIARQSYYKIPAVNLVYDCEEYPSFGILVYLPNEKKYATWDLDHWVLTVFRYADWKTIQKDPARYLSAQWRVDEEIGYRFDPREKYELINGWPF